jgi:hypothetical protein
VALEDHEFLVAPSVLVDLAILVPHLYQGFPYYLAFLQVLFLLLPLVLLAAMNEYSVCRILDSPSSVPCGI